MTRRSRRTIHLAAILAALQLASAIGANADYIYISKAYPERLYLIDGNHILFESRVNTGIGAAPTPDGRFRVYASYRRKTMKGRDPRTGRRYRDRNVPYVMYFDGGRAIHGFLRRGYGSRQSFGCVELPLYKARQLYDLLHGGLGTEVVVASQRPPIRSFYAAESKAPVERYSGEGYSPEGYSGEGYSSEGYSGEGYSGEGYPAAGYPGEDYYGYSWGAAGG